ncbi:MAG: nucleoside deaminase [Oscillospiraceae bacterium]|nr:nucleoside deaminase [Oscillospiraceae bacterium]
MTHEEYMMQALELAKEAAAEGEVPVGCVIVSPEGEIIGRGKNRREQNCDATAHAEVEAIREANKYLGTWRLHDCSMYVTLEPCPMCAGAIINSRVTKLFYGSREEHSGSCGSVINLFMERYGHSPQIVGGILDDECTDVLKKFFENLR